MTPKKRLFNLKKELKDVKKRMDKGNSKNNFRRFVDYYEVITSDHVMYRIHNRLNKFPKNLDFKKIIYINKCYYVEYWTKNNKTYHNTSPFYTYDSFSGYYDVTLEYMEFIRDKFYINSVIDD